MVVIVRGMALPLLSMLVAAGCPPVAWSLVWYTAWVSTVYTEPGTNRTVRGSSESGRYGENSPKENVHGLVGIPRGSSARHMEGCALDTEYDIPSPPPDAGPSGLEKAAPAWIALVAHGGCSWKDKIANAVRKRALAVVVYNEARFGNSTLTMSYKQGTGHTVVIMVGYPKGMEILEPVLKGIPVKMYIAVGKQHVQEYVSGQSVIFVSIAFITMMIISLAWLIFFYIQRFLYVGSQFRNQGLREEAMKAISQLSLHIVKHEDKEIPELDVDAENCAVCIENYKPKDTVRILPCKHVFHRHCIDPWLLEHRTCPMCKLDVIKALGYWEKAKNGLEVPMPESVSSSTSAGNWSIDVEDGDERNETSGVSVSSAHESTLNNSHLKGDACERTALLEMDVENCQDEEHSSGGNNL
uniref:Ring finger protein 149 n=1 Tax=Salvator merianae TaxID=96440 RepID=A0A8D0E8Q7_SALMN